MTIAFFRTGNWRFERCVGVAPKQGTLPIFGAPKSSKLFYDSDAHGHPER